MELRTSSHLHVFMAWYSVKHMANLPLQVPTNLWFQRRSSFEFSLQQQNEAINGFKATTK